MDSPPKDAGGCLDESRPSVKANGALDAYLKSGSLSLVDVDVELANRAADQRFRRRSHAASVACLIQEYHQNHFTVWSTVIRGCCEERPSACCDLRANG